MRRCRHVFPFVAFALCWAATTGAWAQLIPRTPLPKAATITKPTYDTRLTVKFRDDLKVRAVAGDLTSVVSADLQNVDAVKVQFALSFQPMIQLPQETLDRIEAQAGQRSGVAQPDLGGVLSISQEKTLHRCPKGVGFSAGLVYHGGISLRSSTTGVMERG